MTSRNSARGTQSRRIAYRGHSYSGSCLSCNDFVNCCGSSWSTKLDGGSSTKKTGLSRRGFLKVMGGVSAVLAFAPFAAGGQFLIPSVGQNIKEQLIGKKSDVPVNGSTFFWFPFTTDPTYTNILIHLPPKLASETGQEFVAYNRTCVHLQCLTAYLSNSQLIGCPCHGSLYRPTDGWPTAGPAVPIGRYLPSVKLRFDGDDIYAVSINLDEVGYGSATPPSK